MPSGAKRRKAEKRKKEKINNNNNNSSNSSQQGNGDSPRSHDEKDSDSGDLSSPTTFQQHQNPLRRDKEEESKDFSSTGSVLDEPHVENEKSEVGGQEVKVVEVGEGLNHDDDDGEVVITKEVDIESVKEPSGSSTSSNGETKVVEKKSELEPPKVGVKKAIDVVEAVPVTERVISITKEVIRDDPVKGVSQSEGPVQVVEVNLVEEIGDSSVSDLQSKDREEVVLPPSNGMSVETSNGSGHTVESHTLTKSDDQQKDAAPVPPIVRPTSWKSCCGLFDVLTGSSR